MIKFIVALLFISGCSHFGTPKKVLSLKEKQQFLYDFASVNQIVGARIKLSIGMEQASTEKYVEILGQLKGDKAVATSKRLKEFDVKKVNGDARNMFVCVYSTNLGFGACDTTKCAEAEIETISSPNDFEKAFSQLASYDCHLKAVKGD